MATTTLRLSLTVLVIAGAAIILVIQHQTQARLREEIRSLRQQLAQLGADNESLSNLAVRAKEKHSPRLPAPPMHVTASTNTLVEDLPPTNLYARFNDSQPKLTAEQVEAYLKANGRKASSLLAAYRTSGDPALLREAMEKYPNDPQVAFEAVFDKDSSPEEQRQWLNAFEQSAPDNALANYLSALDYFKAGRTDQAVQELTAASGKQPYQYSVDRYQDDEEAYLAAGYSVAEAKRLASHGLPVPHLSPVKQLGQQVVDLAKSYRQAGDEASAQAALQLAANIGQQFDGSPPEYFLLSQLVGMAVERNALGAMDPNSPYGGSGQSVQDRLNQIAQQKAALRELGQQADPLMQTMSDQDWITYTDRRMIFGEAAAMQWVVSKYGQK
jgi:hypothetical protein